MNKIMPASKKSRKSKKATSPRETKETLEKAFSEAYTSKPKNDVPVVERLVGNEILETKSRAFLCSCPNIISRP